MSLQQPVRYTLYTNVFGPETKAVAVDLPPVSFVATQSGALKTSVAQLDVTGALPPPASFNERFLASTTTQILRPALAKSDKLPVATPSATASCSNRNSGAAGPPGGGTASARRSARRGRTAANAAPIDPQYAG